MLIGGLNSGTSMDGVVFTLVEVKEVPKNNTSSRPDLNVKLIGMQEIPYPDGIKEELLRFEESKIVQELCNFHFYLGEIFAQSAIKAMKKLGQDLDKVTIIGSHGQTIGHFPNGLKGYKFSTPSTNQIGEQDIVAACTGITTVGDFHCKDIALGGEAAPDTYMEYCLFRHKDLNRGVLNLGGIANITYLPHDVGFDSLRAFDTGPANMIIDALIEITSGGKVSYDEDGRVASRGKVNQPLLKWMMSHPFIGKKPPKSTGREEFGRHFAQEIFNRGRDAKLSAEDLIATATRFTIESIAFNIKNFLPPMDELILSGGGAKNKTIVKGLSESLREIKVTTTEEYNIPVEARESIGFALMAYETLKGRTTWPSSVTGAKRDSIAGKISLIFGKTAELFKNLKNQP